VCVWGGGGCGQNAAKNICTYGGGSDGGLDGTA
jgi:hypothetical protein